MTADDIEFAWPHVLLGNQPIDGSSLTVGDSSWYHIPEKLGILVAHTSSSAATQRGIMLPPLRSLDAAVRPHQMVVDCGGQGQCGPNTLAYLLGLVNLFDGPGEDLRVVAADHAAQRMNGKTSLVAPAHPSQSLSLRELIEDSISAWPESFLHGLPPTADTWLTLIRRKEAWTDVAFVQACADRFQVCFALTGVNDLGDVAAMFVVTPLDGKAPVAWLEVGCWLNRHFVAIVNISTPSEGGCGTSPERSGPAGNNMAGDMGEWRSFNWPLSTISEVARLIQCQYIRPTALVGMEFSGSVRLALEEQGIRALSVDLRPCDAGGMHFIGDVREVVGLQRWEKVYLFPPCFQQFRGDECLAYKIADGRAFWGIAMVLWCACIHSASSLLVEQSDTIVNDFLPLHLFPDVEVLDAHTSDFGDDSSKPIRLTCRNLHLTTPTKRPAPPYEPFRSQHNHPSPEARDKDRSSCHWARFPHTSAAVASAPAKRPGEYLPPRLDYVTLVTLFARSWAAAGYPVPKDFRNLDAQPSTLESRSYQTVRGAGDGREVDAIEDESKLLSPPSLPSRSSRNAGGETSLADTYCIVPTLTLPELDPDLGVLHSTPHAEDFPNDLSLGPCGDSPPSTASDNRLRPLRFTRNIARIAYIVILCLAARPLVFAHRQGCTLFGILPTSALTNSALSKLVRREAAKQWGSSNPVFLAGEYAEGARLYVTAISKQEASLTNQGEEAVGGPDFSWMSIDQLSGTPIADPVKRCLLTVSSLVRPIEEWTLAYDAAFKAGRTNPQEVISLYRETDNAPPMWQALHQSLAADRRLIDKLENSDQQWLDGWVDVIRPLPIDALPAMLVSSLPSYEDNRLDQYPLPPIWEPYITPLRARQPAQPSASGLPLDCPRPLDLYLPAGRRRLKVWLEAQRRDLHDIGQQLKRKIHPDEVKRTHRPEPIAIGQMEMQRWAQGIIWDCRSLCCAPLDYSAHPSSNLSLTFLARELGGYPDGALFSHIVDGVSLEADVELQTVLVPHLTSLPKGFASVAKELRRLQKATWYDLFWEPPFVPFYLNGQGSVARKLEPDRFRRSTEGGGPRKPTYDASGLQAVSINFAARFNHIPKYFLEDQRPEFQKWMRERGLAESLERARQGIPSDPNTVRAEAAPRFTKWRKEVKPTLLELMQALAVLKRAGTLLDQDVYIFGDDLKDYFNQLRMQAADLWKLNIAFLEEPDDVVQSNAPPSQSNGPRLIFVSEKRLGFGTHPASNVAQRFSYAILDIFRAQMDEQEALFDEGSNQWRALRQTMQDQCHNTTRYRTPPTHGVWSCPQQRLYAAFMYTDDPVFIVVGAERAMRAITVWRQLVANARLLTAIPEKRSLGSWTTWLGVVIVASLGIVFVPQNKLLRAMTSTLLAAHDKCQFHEYRALCGLLEHLRAVLLKGKGVMHGLYHPHSVDGAGQGGPTAQVICTPLMRKQLMRWRTLIAQAGGVSAKDCLLRRRLQPRPPLTFVFDSDACHGDFDTPSGIGGYAHGLYWYFAVPPAGYGWVNTPLLEFMGVCFSIFTADYLLGDAEETEATILLRTDALTSALTLPSESQRSPALVAAYQYLSSTSPWARIGHRLRIQHIFGDANVMADAVSRAKWQNFANYCSLLHITPRCVDLHPEATKLFAHCRDARAASSPNLIVCGALPEPPSTTAPSPALTRLRLACNTQPSASAETTTAAQLAQSSQERPTSPAIVRLQSCYNARDPSPTVLYTREPAISPRGSTDPRAQISLKLPTAARELAPHLKSSALMRATSEYSQLTAKSFVGDGPMDFHVSANSTASMARALSTNAVSGINDNTHTIDARAWTMWETVCAWYQTSPHRTASDVRDFPQRNNLLLTTLMLYAFASCTPRTASASFIKPNSALAYPLAIIRIFGRWGVAMPMKALKATLHQLSRYYLQLHGQYSLVPRRAEPMKYSMVLRINRIHNSAVIDKLPWTDDEHDVFMFKRLNLIMWPTGCRLAEFVGGSELMYFTFESLTWSIGGVVVVHPTPERLRALLPGRDFARLTPPRSKPDQFGETHCPFPIVLMFELREGNAASALRELELRCSVPPCDRPTTPLFHSASRAPYTHSRLDRLFKAVLAHCFGDAVASAYSWHSYRSGLATALHAAGVDDARIQLICRWLCPASLLVYRRMGSAEYSHLTSAAMRTNVDALQSQNIMRLADSPEYADLLSNPVTPQSYTIAAQHHKLVSEAALLSPTRAHERAAPSVSNNTFYANFFTYAENLVDPEVATDAERPSSAGGAAPAPRPSARAKPARPRQPVTSPPRRRARGASPRQPRQRPTQTLPTSDAGSTTGVGALRFRFPDSLANYVTYDGRRSTRRPPTNRYGPARPAQQG